MAKKLNDIKYGGMSVPDTLQLNKAQLKDLSKDQLEGREAVHIMGVEGYIDGEGMWKSTRYVNKLKKSGKWQY